MNADVILDRYDGLLLDLDGTVYRGGSAVAGAVDAVRAAHQRSVAVRFVTNNASRSPETVAAQLRDMGLTADAAEVNTSAQAAAAVLGDRLEPGSAILVVGADALAHEVADVGLKPVATAEGHVAGVVQGFSPDIGWRVLAEAGIAINAGALWVACNLDPTLPTERGALLGNGSLVAALRHATGADPIVAGKPAKPLMVEALAAAGARRALVVGDRLDTDIAGAVTAGLDSLLVLAGVTTPADLLAAAPSERPDYVSAGPDGVLAEAAELAIAEHPGWRVRLVDGTLRVAGQGESLSLLRALCAAWWVGDGGRVAVDADGPAARSALSELGLAGL
ncbi:MAG: HAD-IIA family hydrolase [Sciscionella sp.]